MLLMLDTQVTIPGRAVGVQMGCRSKSWSDGYKNITKVTSFSFSNSPLLENDDQFIHVQPGEVEFL